MIHPEKALDRECGFNRMDKRIPCPIMERSSLQLHIKVLFHARPFLIIPRAQGQ